MTNDDIEKIAKLRIHIKELTEKLAYAENELQSPGLSAHYRRLIYALEDSIVWVEAGRVTPAPEFREVEGPPSPFGWRPKLDDSPT